jgi:SAM-dependent methyltransferase
MIRISLDVFRSLFGWDAAPAVDGVYADRYDRQTVNSLSAFWRPSRVLEIGLNEGRTAELLLRRGPWIKEYVGVDVPADFKPAWDHQNSEVPKQGRAGRFVTDTRLRVVLLDTGTTPDSANQIGQDFDFVFIDADHTYDGVKRDTLLAESILSERAVIVWHDYHRETPGIVEFLEGHDLGAYRTVVVGDTRIAFRFYTGPKGTP